jgi:hypothetical protein
VIVVETPTHCLQTETANKNQLNVKQFIQFIFRYLELHALAKNPSEIAQNFVDETTHSLQTANGHQLVSTF